MKRRQVGPGLQRNGGQRRPGPTQNRLLLTPTERCQTESTQPSFAGHTHVPPASSERTHISGRDLADVRSCRKWVLDICLGGFKAVAEVRFGDQVPRIGWFGRRRYRQQRSSESWSRLLQQSHLQPGLTELGARHSGSPTASDGETPGPTGSECVVREAAAE